MSAAYKLQVGTCKACNTKHSSITVRGLLSKFRIKRFLQSERASLDLTAIRRNYLQKAIGGGALSINLDIFSF